MLDITAGQRWMSESEPELGLGVVLEVTASVVEVLFTAVEERRMYALETAPLKRVVFSVGDEITSHTDETFIIQKVKHVDNVVIYVTEGRELQEGELNDRMSLNKPKDRLLSGMMDHERKFRLRLEGLFREDLIKSSPQRGFTGSRTDLIPHQMSIVSEVSKRLKPRVLLADEVGLGKTIEACMIMHRLHLTGKADRVLILLPESLVHQWFVELLRRFNMLFSIFDEDRCLAIEEHNEVNPFLDSQLVIANLGFLTEQENHEKRSAQLVEAGWDMLIVDEAHHLEWSEQEVSAEYELVEALAKKTEALILLTATPEQLGPEGNFARLRLLDSERFSDMKSYLAESESYESVAKIATKLQEEKKLTKRDISDLKKRCASSDRVLEKLDALADGDDSVRGGLLEDVLDSFGPGRVMFRNTRDHLQGFPVRTAYLSPTDDLLDWLELLVRELDDEKILLIAKKRSTVEVLSEQLRDRLNINVAMFHEGLTLLQRDKNAAYFADEEGAQILLCSEIGSEGRNFQFAHHLVLYDLPEDPELLEQRIGRLDRIGQTGEINIHVPYLEGSSGEVLATWYHDGLNAFEHSLHGATQLYREFQPELEELQDDFDEVLLRQFNERCHKKMLELKAKLMGGQEKLLALNSFRSNEAEAMIDGIRTLDDDRKFQKFVLRLLDHFGVTIEDLGSRNYLLNRGNMVTDLAGEIPDEGMSVTFDRNVALSREEMTFMSVDHPIVRSALEVFLNSGAGNVSFGVWKRGGDKGVLLETYYVIESIAPASLGLDCYLNTRPIRVAVNHSLKDVSGDNAMRTAKLEEGDLRKLIQKDVVRNQLVPAMLAESEKLADALTKNVTEQSVRKMRSVMEDEMSRLQDLAKVNGLVTQQEIDGFAERIELLETALRNVTVKLDSLRLIWQE